MGWRQSMGLCLDTYLALWQVLATARPDGRSDSQASAKLLTLGLEESALHPACCLTAGCICADEKLRHEAVAMVQKAERIAHDAVLQAAQQAAICGLTYTPPSNVQVNLQHVHKVTTSAHCMQDPLDDLPSL